MEVHRLHNIFNSVVIAMKITDVVKLKRLAYYGNNIIAPVCYLFKQAKVNLRLSSIIMLR